MGAPSDIPLIRQAREDGQRTAIRAPEGVFTYRQLLEALCMAASAMACGMAQKAFGKFGSRD